MTIAAITPALQALSLDDLCDVSGGSLADFGDAVGTGAVGGTMFGAVAGTLFGAVAPGGGPLAGAAGGAFVGAIGGLLAGTVGGVIVGAGRELVNAVR